MSLWKKNGVPSPPHEKTLSLLGEGSNTRGEFHTPGSLRIEGQFEGSLRVEGRLVIAPTAQVKGHIQAAQALIAGHFEGTLTTEELLEITATALVKGDIYARRMQMEGGARVEVRCWVGEGYATPPATPSPAEVPAAPVPVTPTKPRRGH